MNKLAANRQIKNATNVEMGGGLFVALLLSLGAAISLFNPLFFLGTTSYWHQSNQDITQYITGFNAFLHEPWQWPLLRISSINWPEGTLITFMDGIPLYAVFLKVLLGGPNAPFFNPYGFWIVLCYLLQGVGAWWVCREAGERSWIALIVLSIVLACYPAMSFRLDHTSLMSQWLIVFAFATYLRSSRLDRVALAVWTILITCAFYINIYLFTMVSVVFCADVLRFSLRGHTWRQLASGSMPYLILAVTLPITMLPLPLGAGGSEWGFGYYSMNVLSPLVGGQLLHWPNPVAHSGQGEGFNYLGVFLVAAFVYTLVMNSKLNRALLTHHQVLAIMLCLVYLYSLSNRIYIGSVHLVDIYMPGWTSIVTGQFRASGRFFWIVGYAIVIYTVLSVVRHRKGQFTTILLLGMTALHLWDLGAHREQIRQRLAVTPAPLVSYEQWDQFLGADVATLYFYPPFRCGDAHFTDTLLPTMKYAVDRGLNISTGYVARAIKPCDGFREQIAAAVHDDTNVFVFLKEAFPEIESVNKLFPSQALPTCMEVGYALLCKRKDARQ